MKKFILPLFVASILFSSALYAQGWAAKMRNEKVNVHDVQKEFYKWYAAKQINKKESDGNESYELFKRWEWYMLPRTYPSGERPSNQKIEADYKNYLNCAHTERQSHKAEGTPNWTYIGNTSVPVNGGGDGRVNHLRFYPGNSSIMYACTPSGGLWKTTNGGTTWSTNTDQLLDLAISDIAIDAKNPNIMYIGTGDNDNGGAGYTPSTIGVLKSTDGGTTWNATGFSYTLQQSGPIAMLVTQLLLDSTNTSKVFAATTFGLYVTSNAGTTWSLVLSGDIRSIEFEPFHNSTIYAGTMNGKFYRSANGGVSFTRILSGLPAAGMARLSIGVSRADSNYVYFVAEDSVSSSFNGLYRSIDKGQTFNQQSNSSVGSLGVNYGWYGIPLAVSPTNIDTLITGGLNTYMSTDGGISWKIYTSWTGTGAPYVHADVHHIEFLSGNSKAIFIACDGGIFQTTNSGSTWNNLSNNLEISQLYAIGLSALTPGLSISGWQDNGTNLSGSPFSQVYGGDGEACFIDYTNDMNMYASYQNGALVASTNGGASWSSATGGITEAGPWTTRWLQDPDQTNSNLLFAGFVNVWISSNQGSSWSQISAFKDSVQVAALAIAPSNDQYIYVAKDSLFTTANSGTTWTNITNALPIDSAYLTGIAVDPKNPLRVWVTFSGYHANFKVYQSTNGGKTWNNLSAGLPNLPANCIAYQAGTPDGIYVGTDMGIYYRDTITKAWVSYNTGLPNVIVNDIEIYYPTNTLVAATYGRGIWQTPAYLTSVKNVTVDDIVKVFPNPNNGVFTVESGKWKAEGVVEIYNVLGEKLYSQFLTFNSQFSIDISRYGKGIYFLTISGNNSKGVKKIVVY